MAERLLFDVCLFGRLKLHFLPLAQHQGRRWNESILFKTNQAESTETLMKPIEIAEEHDENTEMEA